MASRIHLESSGSAAVTPSSALAGWNKTSGAHGPYRSAYGPLLTDYGTSKTNAASGTSGHFTLMSRHIIGPFVAAQTVDGTVKGQIRCNETTGTDSYTTAIGLKVIQADGSDRGTLLAVTGSDDSSTDPPEMNVSTLENRAFRDASENASITLSSVSAQVGDYLVIEIGFRQGSTSVNNATMQVGTANPAGTAPLGDLTEDDTSISTLLSWLEFSKDLAILEYYGSNSVPIDIGDGSGTNTADPTAITPPAGMGSEASYLTCMIGQQRATGATLAITEAGGQSWTTEAAVGITNQTDRLFWCQFDGTWDADPSVDFGATTCNSVHMHVWRAPVGFTWAVNVALAETEDATGPYANPGQTTTGTAPTLTLVGWFTADDNSWDASADAGWYVAGTAQYRNNSGSDQSASYEYHFQYAAGATGAVDKAQNTITGDACTTFAITFSATAPAVVAFIAQKPFIVRQAVNRASTY